jgi:N-acetylneuraminic acid mutarotase
VDRGGEHFGHVLEYMRDGVLAVAEAGALPSVSLLRALKREFGFYCMELCAEEAIGAGGLEMAYTMGGYRNGQRLSCVERYDTSSGQWSTVAAMEKERSHSEACVLNGEIYVTGGTTDGLNYLTSVEKYCPTTDSWSAVAPLPTGRIYHAAIVVGSAMYVFGGILGGRLLTKVFKFDITQGTWSEVAPMRRGRYGMAACAVGHDIYIFGGKGAYLDCVLKFDTKANE